MRRSHLFWGILLLLFGILFLLVNLGVLAINVWGLIWPAVLVLVGIWFLLGPVLSKGERETRQVTIPLEGRQEASIEFKHGAGQLLVSSMPERGTLLEGSFGGGVNVETHGTKLVLSLPSDAWMGVPWGGSSGFRWDVRLNPSVALALRLETGAGESIADLRDLIVKDLRIETGASSTRVILPARAGHTHAKVDAGVASVDLTVPEGVEARIRVESGLSSVNVDSMRFPRSGGIYESTGYSNATNRVDIEVETGVGSVTIH